MRKTPATREFTKVLVANRGEIARRILRTLRQMGLESVAVYSDADRDASHLEQAGEAVRLGPAPSAESYLDQDAVIAAARATGAEAVHPGYGFLAENAGFAERCAAEGLVFIGPSPEAIRRMGDKAEAKALAKSVGVPVVDGFELDGLSAQAIHRAAGELGYPLLIKARAGGGGKGMRRVAGASELDAAMLAAGREAAGAFGDASLLVERWVEAPRHVEVQVLGDAHGHLVHCFERDCSVQRRHQKIFEESPSPAVGDELRARLGQAALALARAVGYRGAGTAEFLLDDGGRFFFLEMNTRLQVEHPVTEAVTGLDLVRLQVDIARGLPLDLRQEDLGLTGHAIEARLYAEDPSRDFLPAAGRVDLWRVPELPGLRVDSGVEQGEAVSLHYDPLLAKVIAHGRSRAEAVRRLRRGLAELAVGGLRTNRDFLLEVLDDEEFRQGEIDTSFLERRVPPGSRARELSTGVVELHAIAACLHLFAERRRRGGPVPPGVPAGWRNNRWRPQVQDFEVGGDRLSVRYVAAGERFEIEVLAQGSPGEDGPRREGSRREVHLVRAAAGEVVAEVDGIRRRFLVGAGAGRRLSVHGLGSLSELAVVPRFPEPSRAAVQGGCVAPMTGKVVEVLVAEGDEVRAGAPLLVLEAMKMEHRLQAAADGVVRAVHVEAGQMVDPDDVLVVVSGGEEDG